MKLVGLEGSGGSTPLKMRVIDDQGVERSIFAKLYARNHVRADRWYKLGRTMLYGRLEDETPFGTVRRFVEYEDYTLRLLGEKGFSTPEPLDIVEITPEREYLIAMEFFEDAVEISEAEVDDRIIDEGLQLIRRMWDIGIAHRDIKPANLMVQDGRLRLIDVFFVQVRPSPWRQAVDLGNMMLVLALRSDPELVYERALAYFTPEELSEAFAATRGVASPSQLRSSMKADGRGLLEAFRELAPPRKPIGIQRWSVRRVLLIIAAFLLTMLCLLIGVALFIPSRGEVGQRGLRHRPDDAADGAGGPDGDDAALHRRAAARLGHRAGVGRPGRSELHRRHRVGHREPGHRDAHRHLPHGHRRSRRSRSTVGASRTRCRRGPSRGRCRRSTPAVGCRSSSGATWSRRSSGTRTWCSAARRHRRATPRPRADLDRSAGAGGGCWYRADRPTECGDRDRETSPSGGIGMRPAPRHPGARRSPDAGWLRTRTGRSCTSREATSSASGRTARRTSGSRGPRTTASRPGHPTDRDSRSCPSVMGTWRSSR